MYKRRSLSMKVELTTIELKALELKDINNFNDKKCASIMSISAVSYTHLVPILIKGVSSLKPSIISSSISFNISVCITPGAIQLT